MDVDASPAVPREDGAGQAGWIRIAVLTLLVVVFGVVVVRFLRHDVVSNWQLLAICPSTVDAAPTPVATTVVTDSCTAVVAEPHAGRGWPVVTFVLPVGATGISSVHADSAAHEMWVEYDLPDGAGRATDQVVLAFVEVPAAALPPVPFAVRGATGLVDVDSVPAA